MVISLIMGTATSKLSYGLLSELREYLDKQEAKLADALLLAVPISTPYLPLHGTGHLRLAQSLERMSSELRKGSIEKSKASVDIVNKAFWDYVEVLESASLELIQRVRHYPITAWKDEFYYIVLGFKELLVHRIEDLIWVFRRIEGFFFSMQTSEYWLKFKKLFQGFFTILDRSILNHLFRTEEMLSTRFKNFTVCFEALRKYIEESSSNETKLLSFPVFPALSYDQQEALLFLCRFLKILEENKKQPVFKNEEITKTIRGIAKPGTMTLYFRDYLQKIRLSFFDIAKLFRETFEGRLSELLLKRQEELDFLKALIGSYREILLSSHRFALSRWIVGPEPKKTQVLLELLYEIDTLKKLFSHLLKSIEKGPGLDFMVKHLEIQRKMDEVLHEMGQPLTSRQQIQNKAERFLDNLELADELGGGSGEITNLVTKWLIKAMRYDSAAQVFPSMTQFGELLMIHQGCLSPLEDIEHEKRMQLFSQVTHHALHWVKEHSIEKHGHDLEVDEATLHETFQNFLAGVQRKALPEKGGWEAYYQMLLDYRVLFARFFYGLRQSQGEGKAVRAHFFFVDQYLEAIELHLKEN